MRISGNRSSKLATHVHALLAVGRENAKALFSAREPELLRSFLEAYQYEPDQRLDVGENWNSVNDCLQAIGVENEQLAMPLSMVFDGGRCLLNEPPQHVYLVRPDVVGFLSTILAELDLEKATASDEIRHELMRLREFYGQAAKSLQCVVFTIGIL
ncbi:MAG: hypothetical protein CMJ82_07310 [Planctomycetaceae bacterium]|nr:hypothetical protein [Planctomycetaceae bacterium]|tara:strand:- start:678 stop:1145 length:468 start_codon:yes stop_codon:yes gene_type:complete